MLEKVRSVIQQSFPDLELVELENIAPQGFLIPEHVLVGVCELLQSNEETYFDLLSCITGIDNGSEANTMEVIYNIYSIPFDYPLVLKILLERKNPEVDSLTGVWRAADWHEREAYDLLGIKFRNHPDLRRILLPNDWEGFPLRKDYEAQEHYHEIKVKY